MPRAEDMLPDTEEFVPTEAEYLAMYKLLLRTTLLGEAMDVRRKEISENQKIFTGLGQEAIGVGAAMAAEAYDYFAPDHRVQHGILLARGFSEKEIICQSGAFAESIFGGYNFGIHIGDMNRHIIRFDSDMGVNTAVSTGVASALYYIRDVLGKKQFTGQSSGPVENPAVLAFFGDGAMSHPNIQSALRFASVYKLPVLFCIVNNDRSLRTSRQYQNPNPLLAQNAAGYGIPFDVVKPANDPVLVWRAFKHGLKYLRQTPGRGPYCIECFAERVSGHNADETPEMSSYTPKGLRNEWLARKPLPHFAFQMREMGLLDERKEKEFKDEVSAGIDAAFDAVKTYTAPKKLHLVFAPSKPAPRLCLRPKEDSRIITYGNAITEALHQGMEIFGNMRVFGEDVESGGAHGRTKNLAKKFGRLRVFHTPLDENGGGTFAIGQSLMGLIPCLEVQFFPFIKYVMGPLMNYAGTHFAVTGENLQMVIRAPSGGGFTSNHCHQEMVEAMFAHAGGIKIVAPATPYAAKGLLLSALSDGNPVIYIEQISHYLKNKGEVPEDPFFVPIGEARVARPGGNVSIVTYGAMMVSRSLKAAEILAGCGISAEVLDLQTVIPMDKKAIIESATKTGKMLVVHEARRESGIGAEIVSFMNSHQRKVRAQAKQCHDLYLKDFMIEMEVLGAEGPVTASPELERLRVPQVEDIVTAVKELAK